MTQRHVLVTGATGYVGGRLVPRLLERGHRVRVMVRDRTRVLGRPWVDQVEVVEADVTDRASLDRALKGVDSAYYLIHAMYAGSDYDEIDRLGATNFAAAGAHLERVIYLGAIQPEGEASTHLSSRAEVGALLSAALPTLEVRAGPIVGSGSASFEMCRYLTERLPVMVTPRWIHVPVRPVAIRTVLEVLVRGLDLDATGPVDIGSEVLTFREMMRAYAEVRGLRPRVVLPTPLLAPGLAARWVGLVTPITNDLAVPLVKGMTAPIIGDLRRFEALFPEVSPLPYRTAVELALDRTDSNLVETRWSGAQPRGVPYRLESREGLIQEQQHREVLVSPDLAWRAVKRVGGQHGWGAWDWAWRLRGRMDQWIGGPGLRRGRRDQDDLLPGEVLDFWRVESLDEENHCLLLRADMRVPGRAWLQLHVEPWGEGSRIVQTALFDPKGLRGLAYWWALYPIHLPVFAGLLDHLEKDALHLVEAA